MSVCEKSLPLNSKRLAAALGQCVGKAVAIIQPCPMMAAPIVAIGGAGSIGVLHRDRLDLQPQGVDQILETDLRRRVPVQIDDDGGLDPIGGGHAQRRRVDHGRGKPWFVRLVENDRQQGRAIDDHRGSPFSSYSQS